MRGLELTRSGIAATVGVAIVVVLCVRLGFWQLDRREQRLERNAAIAERLTAAPLELAALPADTPGLTHRIARLHGRFDHDRSFVLAGRSMGGTPGVHLFTPLRLSGGAVLVNRGWLPALDAVTVDLTRVHRPEGTAVHGTLLPFPDVRIDVEPGQFRAAWFRLAEEPIRAQYPYPVAPLYLVAHDDAEPAGTGPRELASPRPLGPPVLDAGPHLSYAVQWFSFAAIFAIGWVAMALRPRRRRGRPA